jgi:histidine ammonia-lyase
MEQILKTTGDEKVDPNIIPHEKEITEKPFLIKGSDFTPEDLVMLSQGNIKIDLDNDAWKRVQECRDVIEEIITSKKVVYGVNTGFGNFANVTIDPKMLHTLQLNLIRSHAVGVGQPISKERVRMLMALRVNTLAKGHSGVSVETLKSIISAFNNNCLPFVPEKGSVGASGDLAPLAHLAWGVIGEGKMYCPKTDNLLEAMEVLKAQGVTPMFLKEKEGLALINGTQFITSLGAEAVVRSSYLAKTADIIAAVTVESLFGVKRAYDTKIHEVRNHPGQIESADRIRNLIHSIDTPSDFDEVNYKVQKVQDGYSLRCIPQVHGVVHDTLKFVRSIIEREMNAATDNPLIFQGENPYNKEEFHGFRGYTISGGNFHGEYPAKALDFLAIAVHELASISERRVERLVNPALNLNLPAFLIKEGGLNSGFMMIHVTSAALVSENKVLCHPASVDSIPTSAGQEDHVSMGAWAARKCLQVVENVEKVLAIELIAACQALDLQKPLKATPKIEKILKYVREKVPFMSDDFSLSSYVEDIAIEIKKGNVMRVGLEQ